MIGAGAIAQQYAQALVDRCTVTRLSGVGAAQVPLDFADIRCRFIAYQPSDLGGLIIQGDQKGVLLAADLAAAGFPLPLKMGDRITLSDARVVTIQSIDPNTRSYAGVPIAYDVQVRGQ